MPLLEQVLAEVGAEETGSTGYNCRRHELRRIAGASDRPTDSYEGLTVPSIPVDKRVSGRDAGAMNLAALLAANGNLIIAFIVVSAIVLIVLAIYAALKMRKDEFWDEPG
jgi:hypothetical protein